MNWFKKLIFFFNVLAALALLLAYAAPYLSPVVFWPTAFLGLSFPYLILLNILFVIYWSLVGNRRLFLSLLLVIFGYKITPSYLQINLSSDDVPTESIKVLSHNVRVFDLYMWSETKETRNSIFDFIKTESADVLCLQEFYHSDVLDEDYTFKTLDTLLEFQPAKNYHLAYTTTVKEVYHWGIITFSRYPIVGKGEVEFEGESDNVCIYTDIKKGEDTIRVYNTHLASIHLGKHDYKAMEKVYSNQYSERFGAERLLLKKIKEAFVVRAAQAEAIQKSIAASPYPVVVCGDFNDVPASYAYEQIKGDLKDAFIESGNGLGLTYIGKFPSFRIDYIFHDEAFTSYRYTTHPEELSDHHPISTYLELKP